MTIGSEFFSSIAVTNSIVWRSANGLSFRLEPGFPWTLWRYITLRADMDFVATFTHPDPEKCMLESVGHAHFFNGPDSPYHEMQEHLHECTYCHHPLGPGDYGFLSLQSSHHVYFCSKCGMSNYVACSRPKE